MRRVMEGQSKTVMSIHCRGDKVKIKPGGGGQEGREGKGVYQERVEATHNESDVDGGEVAFVGDIHGHEDASQLSSSKERGREESGQDKRDELRKTQFRPGE
jgi:hypothetical protein